MKRIASPTKYLLTFALLAATALQAQSPVPALKDLVGARASSGEGQLESHGYQFVRTEKSDGSAYSYWIEPRSERCVAIRTADGRYQSIVYAPNSDCEAGGGGGDKPKSTTHDKDIEGTFNTVCGVESGGEEHRYRCRAKTEGCHGEGYCRTILTYPDTELRLDWLGEGEVKIQVQGMEPQQVNHSFIDGQTRFEYGGNSYFFYRNPDRGKRELADLEP